jgi:hypothetical protein
MWQDSQLVPLREKDDEEYVPDEDGKSAPT